MTRWMATAVLAVARCGVCLAMPRAAQQLPAAAGGSPARIKSSAPPRAGHAGDWLRRYRGLSPSEQERALQSDPAFRRLSPERQQMLRQRLQHFASLPPQQQQRMLNRMETWEHLTPGQKQQARELFGRMQQLPPDRRRMVSTAVRDLRAMPPGAAGTDHRFQPLQRHVLPGGARHHAWRHQAAAGASGEWPARRNAGTRAVKSGFSVWSVLESDLSENRARRFRL